MTGLKRILILLLTEERWSLARGAALSIAVLAMGVGLLSLSGWFVAAAAAAGLAGIGIAFDFFRPSAGVRFLALGRAGARYGERLLTHDATLRALAGLRVRLLARLSGQPFGQLTAMRGAQAMNRLTADVDALDGIALRLVLPVFAGGVVLVLSMGLVWLTLGLTVALWIGVVFAGTGWAAFRIAGRAALAPAKEAEAASQALRAQVIDLLRLRTDLAVAGALVDRRNAALAQDVRARHALARLDRIERGTGAAYTLAIGLAAAGALVIGSALALSGLVSGPQVAIGFFAALALGEALAATQRGIAELGRMSDAATRVSALLDAPLEAPRRGRLTPDAAAPVLAVSDLTYRRHGAAEPVFAELSLTLQAGETVLLEGRSGVGKSTLLLCLARLLDPAAGEIRLLGVPLADWPEAALRARLGLVPQRTALIAGSARENLNLALADPAEDEVLWGALRAVALDHVIAARGGLDTLLTEGGGGLSGGETRRLALARAVLRRPDLLLLDEPTEGLDAATAQQVLAGLRSALPRAAILIASHRDADRGLGDRVLRLGDK